MGMYTTRWQHDWWIEMDLAGSGNGLNEVLSWHLSGGAEKTYEKLLVSCLASSPNSEDGGDIFLEMKGYLWTTMCYNPDDCTFYCHYCENLKSGNLFKEQYLYEPCFELWDGELVKRDTGLP
jgi:hypothetical protein